jgi:hypothetical protein
MGGSYPNYCDVPPEFDLLTLFGHLSAADRLNRGSSEF